MSEEDGIDKTCGTIEVGGATNDVGKIVVVTPEGRAAEVGVSKVNGPIVVGRTEDGTVEVGGAIEIGIADVGGAAEVGGAVEVGGALPVDGTAEDIVSVAVAVEVLTEVGRADGAGEWDTDA